MREVSGDRPVGRPLYRMGVSALQRDDAIDATAGAVLVPAMRVRGAVVTAAKRNWRGARAIRLMPADAERPCSVCKVLVTSGTMVWRNAFAEDGYVHDECRKTLGERATARAFAMGERESRQPFVSKVRACHYCKQLLATGTTTLACDECRARFGMGTK